MGEVQICPASAAPEAGWARQDRRCREPTGPRTHPKHKGHGGNHLEKLKKQWGNSGDLRRSERESMPREIKSWSLF